MQTCFKWLFCTCSLRYFRLNYPLLPQSLFLILFRKSLNDNKVKIARFISTSNSNAHVLIPSTTSTTTAKCSLILNSVSVTRSALSSPSKVNANGLSSLALTRWSNITTYVRRFLLHWNNIIYIIMGKTKGGFYAVARGKQVGVFLNWDDCKAQVNGFPNARYKKFDTQVEAETFISENGGNPITAPTLTSTSFSSSSSSASASFATKPTVSASKFLLNRPKSDPNQVPATEIDMEEFHPQVSSRNFSRNAIFRGLDSKSSNKLDMLSNSQFEKQETERSTNILKRAGFAVGSPSTSVNSNSSISTITQKRNFSTSKVLDKRKLKVSEDVVVNKRQKTKNTSSASTTNNVGVDVTDFSVDDAGYIVVFTDGACSHNGNNGAKAGIGVWFGDGHNLNISEPVRGRQTNNTAEILAAEKAILQAKGNGINKLNVQTDSQFVINCITKWITKWKRNGWKLANGKPVINRFDLEKLDAAMSDMDIKWSYVAGHRGHYGNEAADRLAVEGANKK